MAATKKVTSGQRPRKRGSGGRRDAKPQQPESEMPSRKANFLALRPIAVLAIRHWTGSTWSETLFSVPGAAMPQLDRSTDESASADQVN